MAEALQAAADLAQECIDDMAAGRVDDTGQPYSGHTEAAYEIWDRAEKTGAIDHISEMTDYCDIRDAIQDIIDITDPETGELVAP